MLLNELSMPSACGESLREIGIALCTPCAWLFEMRSLGFLEQVTDYLSFHTEEHGMKMVKYFLCELRFYTYLGKRKLDKIKFMKMCSTKMSSSVI